MKNTNRILRLTGLAACALVIFAVNSPAQQTRRAPYDIKNYKMDVVLEPSLNKLSATVDVALVPKAETRVLTFELNGSLLVESVERVDEPSIEEPEKEVKKKTPKKGAKSDEEAVPVVTFVQDRVGVTDIGPSIRVDLGGNVSPETAVTLRFKYAGILVTAEGGPLLTKRLAFVGPNDGYLMYAARWFPFHDYAADKAASDISFTLPDSFSIIGHSDVPPITLGDKHRFVVNHDALVGNFAYGRYVRKDLGFAGYDLQFNTKAGVEQLVDLYGGTLGKALEYYTRRFGSPAMGKKLLVVQIDDDSLEYYSQEGMLFLANRLFNGSSEVILERLQREAAYQWWGLTVGLKSFDDAWLSQGLAEYSAFSLRESQLTGARLDSLRRELLEKSLTFEQTSSLARTPASLDDQSVAYHYIMYSKGAIVFKLLRDTMGEQKFDQFLRNYLKENRSKNVSIDEFEAMASKAAGRNLRYFFARWVEGTGVPEFKADYVILRTRDGRFITRGTVKENYDNLRLPLDLQLRAEGQGRLANVQVFIEDSSADFNIESKGKPIELIIDPKYKLLRISDELRISSIARRGIEQFREGNYVEAQQQFEAALRLDRSNAWIYYHLGLLFLKQRNYDLAIDNFKSTRNLGKNGQASPTWLHVWAEIKMGNAYDAKGDRTRAVAAYKRAEKIGDSYDNAQTAVEKYLAEPFDPRKQETTAIR